MILIMGTARRAITNDRCGAELHVNMGQRYRCELVSLCVPEALWRGGPAWG